MRPLMESPHFYTFEVRGQVVGSARPRVTSRGTYIPKKTRDYRALILAEWLKLGREKFDGPISVHVFTHRKLPKTRPKKVTREPDIYKPDADNIAKNVMDALNGHAWDDDSQIVEISVVKCDRMRIDEEFISIRIAKK